MKQPAATFLSPLLGALQSSSFKRHCWGATLELVLAAGLVTAGCSGGSPAGGGTGGTSGGGASGTLGYKPCPEGMRLGGFSLQLVAASAAAPPAPAYTDVAGGVKDAPDPVVRMEVTKDGACVLTDALILTCAPACTGSQICAGNNRCITEPTFQNVGTVTVTGLPSAVNLMPPATKPPTNQYSAQLTGIAYPPFADGAAVKLSTGGGKYPAFTLLGQGITPLESSGDGLQLARNSALNVTWTPPPSAGVTRIIMSMDISHHGGGAARIDCDVPDTGSATIPGGLINELLDRGSAGFPQVLLTRRTVDSVTIAPGCVDFLVASSFKRALTVDGEVSCNCDETATPCKMFEKADQVPCPMGQTCRQMPDPKALTCRP